MARSVAALQLKPIILMPQLSREGERYGKLIRKPIDNKWDILYYCLRRQDSHHKQAEVVKSVDTQRSGRCALTGMGVRVPPSAPPTC
jgi:hypothetical protein